MRHFVIMILHENRLSWDDKTKAGYQKTDRMRYTDILCITIKPIIPGYGIFKKSLEILIKISGHEKDEQQPEQAIEPEPERENKEAFTERQSDNTA